MEQIVCNTDIQSYYFYFRNKQLYSGPAWDYDLAVNENYCSSVVFSHRRFGWYNKIFENDAIKEYLINEYATEIQSQAYKYLQNLKILQAYIDDSNKMNMVRWKDIYKSRRLDEAYERVNDYTMTHLNYLDKALLENAYGCILRVVNEGEDVDYLYFADENGVIDYSDDNVLANSSFVSSEDSSLFDPSVPLKESISIIPMPKEVVGIIPRIKRLIAFNTFFL